MNSTTAGASGGHVPLSQFFVPLRPLLKGWVVALACWTAYTAIAGGEFVAMASAPWSHVIRFHVRDSLSLALVAPLLFRLASRYPLEAGWWKRRLPLYLVALLITWILCQTWAWLIPPPEDHPHFGPEEAGRHFPFGDPFRPGALDSTDPFLAGPPLGLPPKEHGPHHMMGNRPWLFFFFGPGGGVQISLFLALVSVAHALHFYQRAQERSRRTLELSSSLAKARLATLKAQLQPHFLFNSLNAISALVHKDAEAADEMLGALSDFLRLTLEDSGEHEIPLKRELELVRRYLAIESVRFGDRLSYTIDTPPDTLNVFVPPLILQPLVENAVRHGLDTKTGAGLIAISAQREDESFCLSVKDNGVGWGDPNNASEGIGLANTRARLREMYGDRARLEIQDHEGVAVIIRFPYHSNLEL